jgi:hypothetical protein
LDFPHDNDGTTFKSIIEYTYPESHAISGVAYTDTNANNQLDGGDFRAGNQTITLTADLAQPIDLVGGGNQFCARLDDGRATCWGRRGDAWRWGSAERRAHRDRRLARCTRGVQRHQH